MLRMIFRLGSLSNYRLLLQKGDKTRSLSIKQHAIAGCGKYIECIYA
jgi:hypothetical protein